MRMLRNNGNNLRGKMQTAALDTACVQRSQLTCWCCGERIEVQSAALRELQSSLAAKHGFQLLHPVHELTGLCAVCRCDMRSDQNA